MPYLIVNADDYAYSDSVSRGILFAANHGIVTATGVLSNSPHFTSHVQWLNDFEALDIGVHLNLTFGAPVTECMKETMRSLRHGCTDFCENKFWTAGAVLTGKIPLGVIEAEWDAQIRLCVESCLPVRFFNSHEHLHALPQLFGLTRKLAERYRVAYVRVPNAEWRWPLHLSSVLRNIILQLSACLMPSAEKKNNPELLGIACSGKLRENYLFDRLSELRPGRIYELMCHPGYAQLGEITDQRLLAYHDWQGELDALCSPAVGQFIHSRNIELIGFRNIPDHRTTK